MNEIMATPWAKQLGPSYIGPIQKAQQNPCIKDSHIDPEPDTFEKFRDTPPISVAMFLPKHVLVLVGNDMYTTHLYHHTAPIRDASPEILGSGVVGTPPPPPPMNDQAAMDV